MSIEACQKLKINYAVYEWDSPIPELGVKNKTLCAEGTTEERARTSLTEVINGICTDTRPKRMGSLYTIQVETCNPASDVTVALKKPNLLQRLGIKMSDLWSRVF